MDIRNSSLNELESSPEADTAVPTPLVEKILTLRKKKIGGFTVEDFRLMVSQQHGLLYLVPLALDILEKNPFAEGDYYEGDLLASLLICKPAYWKQHPASKLRMDNVLDIVTAEIDGEDFTPGIRRLILGAINQYQSYGL